MAVSVVRGLEQRPRVRNYGGNIEGIEVMTMAIIRSNKRGKSAR
jgi:hypothetical protein